jgi:UDP:flavonoid glycosyltransferase YjiC (YdhE family)
VYLSFGSVAPTTPMYPRLYRAAIERLAPLPSRLLVSTGRRDPAELGRLPANVHVERWVDEDAIGHHAAAMVSHGGAGSIRGALAAGVPLVVLPLFAEQPDNAAAVAATGAGIAVEGVAGIDDALRVLLADAAYARRAQAIAAEIAALPPVSEAVRLLAQIADSTSSAARSPVATAPFR